MDGIESTIVFLPEQVYNFVEATEDTNPIHRIEKPVVPGLLLGLAAKKAADGTLASHGRDLRIDFRRGVYTGTELKLTTKQGMQPLTTIVDFKDNAGLCALCTLSSDSSRVERPSGENKHHITEHALLLSPEPATIAARESGIAEPYAVLAIGLLSKILLEHGKDFVEARTRAGQVPVYVKQEFTFFPAIAHLTAGELTALAATRITDAPRALTRVEMRAQGQPVYKCQTYIAFVSNS